MRHHIGRTLVCVVAFFSVACREKGPPEPGDAAAEPQRADAMAAAPEAAQAAFNAIGGLAGDWTGHIGRKDTTNPAQVSFRLTAKGSAILERMIIEDPVEMVSVYHFEKGALVLSHYCAAGNHPRMVLSRGSAEGPMRFALSGAQVLDTAREVHMHSYELNPVGSDQLQIVWQTFVNGKREGQDTMFLMRRATNR